MVVNFGSTHKGKTFLEMWDNHQKWIGFMTERYRQSPKVEHRRLMEFIELKIQEAETLGVLIPLTDRPETGGYQQGATPAAKGSTMKYKPKPKPTGKLVQPRSQRDGRTGGLMVRSRATTSDRHTGGRDGPSGQDAEPGDHASASSESTEPAVIRDQCFVCNDLAGDVDSLEDWILKVGNDKATESVTGPLNRERARLHHLVKKYTQELNDHLRQAKSDRMPCTLFEGLLW